MLGIKDDAGEYAASLKQYHRQPVVPRKAIDCTPIGDAPPSFNEEKAREAAKEGAVVSHDEDMIPDPDNEVQDGPAMKGLGKGFGSAASGIGSGVGSLASGAGKGAGEAVAAVGHGLKRLSELGEE